MYTCVAAHLLFCAWFSPSLPPLLYTLLAPSMPLPLPLFPPHFRCMLLYADNEEDQTTALDTVLPYTHTLCCPTHTRILYMYMYWKLQHFQNNTSTLGDLHTCTCTWDNVFRAFYVHVHVSTLYIHMLMPHGSK